MKQYLKCNRNFTFFFYNRDLVGREVMQEKRSYEEEPNSQALTPTAKVKPQKRSQFSLRRRKFRSPATSNAGDELDFEDLICPLENGEVSLPVSAGGGGAVPKPDGNPMEKAV